MEEARTPGRAVVPWFYAIAANEIHAVTWRRSRARARETDLERAEVVTSTRDPEAELVREEVCASVRAAIADLDDALGGHGMLRNETRDRRAESHDRRRGTASGWR